MKAFSVALAAGALSFLMSEWRYYRNSFRQASDMLATSPDTPRLLRRALGSGLLFVMSVLIFMGQLPAPGQTDPDQVMRLFYYWLVVIALAMTLAVLAVVDALSGVKRLGSVMSLEQARELSTLAEQLRSAQLDR